MSNQVNKSKQCTCGSIVECDPEDEDPQQTRYDFSRVGRPVPLYTVDTRHGIKRYQKRPYCASCLLELSKECLENIDNGMKGIHPTQNKYQQWYIQPEVKHVQRHMDRLNAFVNMDAVRTYCEKITSKKK